jgi:anti-sigma-K factor RskA
MAEGIRCEEVEELAGAYALGALTPEEQSDVEGHLAGCDRHEDIASLVATAQAIAMTAPPMEPPPALKTRLMDAVRSDPASEGAPAPSLSGEQEERPGILERLFRGPRLGLGLAAAAAVVVAFLLIISPWEGGDDEGTLVRTFQEGNISGEVTYDPNEQSTSMRVEGLDPLPAGSVYQVWAITDDEPDSIGFLEVPDTGEVSAVMEGVELSDGQVVAVTVEPEGGSPEPTTEPVFGVEI